MIVITTSNGVAVMRLVGDADPAKCVEQWKQAHPGQYVSHAEMDEAALPKDRSARSTWRMVNGKIVAGPPVDKAKEARLAWGASMGLNPAQVNAMFPPDVPGPAAKL